MEYELIRQLVLEYLRRILDRGRQGQNQVSSVFQLTIISPL